MRRARKPFELFSTSIPDGRRVVGVVATTPRQVTFWVVARSPQEALRRVRDLGVPDARIERLHRPLGAAVDLAAADPAGGVFRPGVYSIELDGYRSLADFEDHLTRAR